MLIFHARLEDTIQMRECMRHSGVLNESNLVAGFFQLRSIRNAFIAQRIQLCDKHVCRGEIGMAGSANRGDLPVLARC